MKKAEKPFFVDNLAEELKSATSLVLVDYTGLTVALQQELKKKLKSVGASLLITKNTLFKLAGTKASLPSETLTDSVLSGPTALVISEGDPIAPLQVLAKFATEKQIPQFKVGIVEGKFQDKDSLSTLSKLPSKDVLLAQVVGGVAAPLYGIVSVLGSNMSKLIYILNSKAKGGE